MRLRCQHSRNNQQREWSVLRGAARALVAWTTGLQGGGHLAVKASVLPPHLFSFFLQQVWDSLLTGTLFFCCSGLC